MINDMNCDKYTLAALSEIYISLHLFDLQKMLLCVLVGMNLLRILWM